MTAISHIYQALKPGGIYRVSDVAAEAHVDYDEAYRQLNTLSRAGLVERIAGDADRGRKWLYKTRQIAFDFYSGPLGEPYTDNEVRG